MVLAHHLGFPRIGLKREIKKAVEAYWRGELTQQDLLLRRQEALQHNWQLQVDCGLDYVTVGDFSWYDHILDTSFLFGIIPSRFIDGNQPADLNTYFCMARGKAPNGQEALACEMTKWFDTNYHYIVPELTSEVDFSLHADDYLATVQAALEQGFKVKPVLVGPLTLLWLAKTKSPSHDKLSWLARLLPAYQQLLTQLAAYPAVEWVQIDEPILVLDLPSAWQQAFTEVYKALDAGPLKIMLATYFADLADNTELVCKLPVAGLHIDCCRSPQQINTVVSHLPENKILSAGVIDGRNIWRADLSALLAKLRPIKQQLGERLWVASSCSLLHCPIDLDAETKLDKEFKSWLAFAKQKLVEISLLRTALNEGDSAIHEQLTDNQQAMQTRRSSTRIHSDDVKKRLDAIQPEMAKRHSVYRQRAESQRKHLHLPVLPTTTIGSFPQTKAIRLFRRDFKQGRINQAEYEKNIKQEIANVIHIQEEIGLDVLVHGEAERNDMVEYFGEHLQGVAFTENGWVQSYGSRCVKPPIIFGDIKRASSMTVAWSKYAQSLTTKPVKGMLTGPVTILAWSFVRDDQPESTTALQIALALRDEVCELEAAGIHIIQIDEPAFREILPLQEKSRSQYLEWAVYCFRIASCGVQDRTQIHTHMCYSEFNNIIESIAALDADVITLESSRSDMELLQAFETFSYPNEIGPGVYDIHSPRVPNVAEIKALLVQALKFIPYQQLWVNPDCGLKTRDWPEVKLALAHLVAAACQLRKDIEDQALPFATSEAVHQ